MADDVKVTISADDKPLEEAFKRATKHITDFGKNASDAINKANGYANTMSALWAGGIAPSIEIVSEKTEDATSKMSLFTQSALGVAAGQFAFNALQRAIGFVKDSIAGSLDAYADQEDALNKLNQSLRITGSYSESASQDIESFASELEATSVFSDDAIVRQIAFARSLGATTQQSKELVTAAANLSSVLGGSLEENTDKLGKTLSGTAGRLSQYFPELNSLTEAQLKAGGAAKYLNEKFGGSAANDLNTHRGASQALANSFNNLQETLGEVIEKSGPYQAFLKISKQYIDDLNASMAANALNSKIVSGEYQTASKTSQQLAEDSETLKKKITALKAELQQSEDMDLFNGQTSNATELLFKIQQVEMAKKKLDDQISSGVTAAPTPDLAIKKTLTTEERKAMEKRGADIIALDAQIALQRQANADQAAINNITNETFRNNAEIARTLEFEIKKTEILATQKLKTAQSSLEGDALIDEKKKIKLEKDLAQIELYGKKENASRASLLKVRQAAEDAMTAYDKKQDEKRISDRTTTFATIATLSNANNKTLAAIGKAAAITQIAIATPEAVASSFAFGSKTGGPVLGFLLGGIAATAMAAQASNLAGVKFETGGIVPGLNQFGDQTQIRVNPKEAVLTQDQQKEFMDIANGRSGNGGNIPAMLAQLIQALREQPITLNLNGRELGSAIRDLKSSGYAI